VVVDVPEESINMNFGLFLIGVGKMWLDEVKFEIVDNTVPLTGLLPKPNTSISKLEQCHAHPAIRLTFLLKLIALVRCHATIVPLLLAVQAIIQIALIIVHALITSLILLIQMLVAITLIFRHAL
jgi:hypothetical protein